MSSDPTLIPVPKLAVPGFGVGGTGTGPGTAGSGSETVSCSIFYFLPTKYTKDY